MLTLTFEYIPNSIIIIIDSDIHIHLLSFLFRIRNDEQVVWTHTTLIDLISKSIIIIKMG